MIIFEDIKETTLRWNADGSLSLNPSPDDLDGTGPKFTHVGEVRLYSNGRMEFISDPSEQMAFANAVVIPPKLICRS
ncbi:MAG: hypothetical protein LBV45_03435 [Xanthomonadaceae bacterium]|jgi:hypothetical protein|nr:hypothetical protein [Xanthomonadaceae bacterium]